MPTALVTSHPSYDSYRSAGFHNRLGWGTRPALIVIDVCLAYWHNDSDLSLLSNPSGASSPDSIRRLVAAARMGNVPIIWAQVRYNHPRMLDGGMQYQKSKGISIWQDGDTRGMDTWLEGLTPNREDIVVYKKNPSAFFATNLCGQLNGLGIDTIVLCGVSTSGCVRATAVDACGFGFRCMVVEEACGDRSMEIQRATLFDLDARFADVVMEEEAVERIKAGWK